VCATIQSISRPSRLRQFDPAEFDLVVVDEADLGIAPSYVGVLERFPKARIFGCTATPDRGDGKTLSEVFQSVAATVDMAMLIQCGYLAPLSRYLVRIESVSLAGLSTRDGDFSDAQMEKVLTQERALHEVVRPTLELATNRQSLVFATSVAHAEQLAAVFNRYQAGCARVVHGNMSDSERTATIAAFERREFQFLCNCALLLRGINLPFVSCVAMARPTLSRSLYTQCIGRGMRVAPGKDDLLVLDFTDNSRMHDLISPIDVLAPDAPSDVKERAREIINEEHGTGPAEALECAEAQLAIDPALREQIRAQVKFYLSEAKLGGPKGIDWDAMDDLGKVPDGVIAQRLGITSAAVLSARKKRGIEAFGGQRTGGKGIDWDSVSDLGSVPDAEIAQRLNISVAAVGSQRQRRGIERFRGSGGAPSKDIDWSKQPLGKVPDVELARQLGLHHTSVMYQRRKRKIPLFAG
jgi:hypothetical protein